MRGGELEELCTKVSQVDLLLSHFCAAAKSLQSCPTLCDPIDSSPPGSSVHGIFQARVLEWGAIAFSEVTSIPVLKPNWNLGKKLELVLVSSFSLKNPILLLILVFPE